MKKTIFFNARASGKLIYLHEYYKSIPMRMKIGQTFGVISPLGIAVFEYKKLIPSNKPSGDIIEIYTDEK